MLDKPIKNALLALRKQTIREDGEGLAQVEALLQIRGVALVVCATIVLSRAEISRWCARGLRSSGKARAA